MDTQRYSIPDPSHASRLWSDRHFGIGADGLVRVGTPGGNTSASEGYFRLTALREREDVEEAMARLTP